eukprot:2966201-Prymnesium_polylepis.1
MPHMLRGASASAHHVLVAEAGTRHFAGVVALEAAKVARVDQTRARGPDSERRHHVVGERAVVEGDVVILE